MTAPDPIQVYKIQSFLHLNGFNPNGVDGGLGGGLRSAIGAYLDSEGIKDNPAFDGLRSTLNELNADAGNQELREQLTNDFFAHVEAEMAKPEVKAAMIDKAQAALTDEGTNLTDWKAAAFIADMVDPNFTADPEHIIREDIGRSLRTIEEQTVTTEETQTLRDKAKVVVEDGKEIITNLQENESTGPYLDGAETGVRIPLGEENPDGTQNTFEAGYDFGLRAPVANFNISTNELSTLNLGFITNTPDFNSGLQNSITGAPTRLGSQHTSQYSALGAQYNTTLNPSEGTNELTENIGVSANAGFSLGGLEGTPPVTLRRDPTTNELNVDFGTPTLIAGVNLTKDFNLNATGDVLRTSLDATTFYALSGDNPGLGYQANASTTYHPQNGNDQLDISTSAYATHTKTPGANASTSLSLAANFKYDLTGDFALAATPSVTFGPGITVGTYIGTEFGIGEEIKVQAGANFDPKATNPITPQIGVVHTPSAKPPETPKF